MLNDTKYLVTVFALQIVELKVEMVCIHEKRLRKCLSKLKGLIHTDIVDHCHNKSELAIIDLMCYCL